MNNSVVIVDYGVGNLRSVARALEVVGGEPRISGSPEAVLSADRLVLPGVGAFSSCREALEAAGLADAVVRRLQDGRPALGICVGMQILFDYSTEFGRTDGLGVFGGGVEHIPVEAPDGRRVRAPFIGWSALQPSRNDWSDSILRAVEPGETVYFVHSYAARPAEAAEALAHSDYGAGPVCAAVSRGAVSAVQFHPERSGPTGLKILRSFLEA